MDPLSSLINANATDRIGLIILFHDATYDWLDYPALQQFPRLQPLASTFSLTDLLHKYYPTQWHEPLVQSEFQSLWKSFTIIDMISPAASTTPNTAATVTTNMVTEHQPETKVLDYWQAVQTMSITTQSLAKMVYQDHRHLLESNMVHFSNLSDHAIRKLLEFARLEPHDKKADYFDNYIQHMQAIPNTMFVPNNYQPYIQWCSTIDSLEHAANLIKAAAQLECDSVRPLLCCHLAQLISTKSHDEFRNAFQISPDMMAPAMAFIRAKTNLVLDECPSNEFGSESSSSTSRKTPTPDHHSPEDPIIEDPAPDEKENQE